ncbi:hypothetical protein MKW98_022004 [Papaver atlanticum]|uniref:Uncharacterized protein n=1 Tax=Papaver atlanticum TaxID=357466 RepID=A0AAD4S7D0_9MAGN|nr:hypothetical protein MKW98_022004 [Papaver atlanticum]
MEFKKRSILGPRRRIFAVKQHRKPLVVDSVVDIDKKDIKNPLAVVEYVEDLYKFYKLAETSSQIGDYMSVQTEIDEDTRMSVVGCLVQFHIKLNLATEVLFLGIHILDRYLCMNLVARKELPLVGLTALLIANKYEDDSKTPVEEYFNMADEFYSKKDILDMEKLILRKLGWTLAFPTAYHFLVRFIKAAEADKEMENTIFLLAVSSLMQYEVIKSYPPSIIAASSVYAANWILKKTTLWSATLQHYTGFCESQVMECSKRLMKI